MRPVQLGRTGLIFSAVQRTPQGRHKPFEVADRISVLSTDVASK